MVLPCAGTSKADELRGGDLAALSRPALRVFRDRDGLPENAPMALAFDPRGVLWVGTQDGLGSYDGRAFHTFNAPKREVSNFFQTIHVDATGAVWCGLVDGGLARLDAGRWTTFEGSGLPSERIDAIIEGVAPEGGRAIWVATPAGAARKDGDHWTTFGEADGLPSARVAALLDGHDGTGAPVVYAGTSKGVAVSHGAAFTPLAGAPAGAVDALYEQTTDAGRALWVSTFKQGLARFARGAWTHFVPDPRGRELSIRAITETIAPDGAHTLWFGSDEGPIRFDGERFTSVLDDALPSTTLWSLLADPAHGPTHTLWIGVDGGLARLRPGGFRSLPGEAATKSAYGLLVTHDASGEALWLGTRGAGLQRFDGRSWTRLDGASGLPDDTIYAITEVDEGGGKRAVWVGTTTGGLARYADGAWTIVMTGMSTVRQIHPFSGDDGAPILDVATGNSGVFRRARGAWEHIDVAHGLPTNDVFDVIETRAPGSSAPSTWVATDGAGLLRRDGATWSRFDRKSSALLSDTVLSLHVVRDAKGRDVALWAGTQGGGVSVLDLADPHARFRTFTEGSRPALPNDTIYSVQDDGHGQIFLFTNQGVARLTPREATTADPSPFTVRTFTTEDGLPANECNGGSSFIDDHGRIWAGTVSGVAFFDPKAEVRDEAIPPLDLASRLSRSGATLAADARLPYDQSSVDFDYLLPRLFRGSETTYRTQLGGLEATPGPWSLEAHHEYAALPEGDYVFRVWARDFEGHERGPAAVAFHVRPAPWATWWATALYAITLGAAAWAIARYHVYALERRNAFLETKITERTVDLGRKVSELAVSESRARTAEEDARRADRAKSLFLSTMSHELRTPLNAILGFAQLLVRDRALSRAHQEDVEVIQRSGEHLLGLINDVLSIARIEAGMVLLENRAFRLEEAVRGATKIVGPRARAKGLRLVTEIGRGMPPAVQGDEGKVRQILLNLLGNAVKFTARGTITVRAQWSEGNAVLEVADTGPGISEAELPTLFAPFMQSEAGRSNKEGTGLGLAITRSYAQRMGGDVTATSTVGVGTTFRCTIALERAEQADAPPLDQRVVGLARGSGPYKALIVDDAPENRRLLARMLGFEGFEIREAATGEEAVRAVETFAPHVVLMDVHMPGMDGATASRAIRSAERKAETPAAKRTKIVALSASVVEGDRDLLLRESCDAFVSKPFREALFFDTLETVLGAQFIRASESDGMRVDSDAATPERLARIAEPLRTKLYEAARGGDLGGARDAVETVAESDAELAASLRMLVDAFLLEEIEARMNPNAPRADSP